MTGAEPRFLDVDDDSLLLDPARLEAAFDRERIHAVVAVHLYGNAAPIAAIRDVCRRHDALLVEDCAQSHGAAVVTDRGPQLTGTFGDAAAFSFYPTKNLGAYGDGGAAILRDEALRDRVVRLRNYGYTPERRDFATEEGWNSRLDEIQAAILRKKLPLLDGWNLRRRAAADRYDAALEGNRHVRPVRVPKGTIPCRHLYVVRTARRDALKAHLAARGLDSNVHYPVPIHTMPAYARFATGPCPVAERAATEILSLPMHPFLDEADTARVCRALAEFVG